MGEDREEGRVKRPWSSSFIDASRGIMIAETGSDVRSVRSRRGRQCNGRPARARRPDSTAAHSAARWLAGCLPRTPTVTSVRRADRSETASLVTEFATATTPLPHTPGRLAGVCVPEGHLKSIKGTSILRDGQGPILRTVRICTRRKPGHRQNPN